MCGTPDHTTDHIEWLILLLACFIQGAGRRVTVPVAGDGGQGSMGEDRGRPWAGPYRLRTPRAQTHSGV